MSNRLKKPKNKTGVQPTLPRRNREEHMLRRIASELPNQQALEAALQSFPRQTHDAWISKLAPYLKFQPRWSGSALVPVAKE
jgi:hypothetical protein